MSAGPPTRALAAPLALALLLAGAPVALHATPAAPAGLAAFRRAPARGASRGASRGGAPAAARAPLGPSNPAVPEVPAGVSAMESAPIRAVDGVGYLGAGDLARLMSATRYWRADVRKLVLRAGPHRLLLTVDDPFVLVDDRTVRLHAPVRALGGELMVPVEVAGALPVDATLARLVVEPRRGLVFMVPREGLVGTPSIAAAGELTRVTFPVDRPERVQVIGRSRARFRVRVSGAFTGVVPDTLPPGTLVGRLAVIPSGLGSAFELSVGAEARGFRVQADSAGRRVTLEFARAPLAGFEPFAGEEASGPRSVRVIVLDPAHGGADPGVEAGGAVEKDLTLALARLLAPELARRLGARVVLTRTDDSAVPIEARAEAANRARADLVLVLHFDGSPAAQARGATVYCPPATVAAAGVVAAGAAPLAMVPWRDVALRHAVASRALGEAVLGALELRGLGPTRLREVLPLHLLGVNAPGVSLECATLTSEADRARVTGSGGLAALASAIAEGVVVWQRNE